MKTAILKNINADISIEINLDDTKSAAKALREAGHQITAATLNRIVEKQKSSAGWTLEIDGSTLPWSDRDIKLFGITEAIQPSFETMTQIVSEEVEAPIVEAKEQVVETIIEEIDTSADPDDIKIDTAGVTWLKRNPKGPQEVLKIRKNSKVWEIIVALKKQRMSLSELQSYLYEVGFDEDQITDYKTVQAFYDVAWKGYNIAKVKCEDGETRYAIRNLDFSKVTTILTY